MSDDDEQDTEEETDVSEKVTVESLRERLEAIQERLDAAETEDDLDEVETDVEDIESDLDAADLPEPDDEDDQPPEKEISDEIETVRDDLEQQRGPYAEDVATETEETASRIAGTRWTDDGLDAVTAAVREFLDRIAGVFDADHSIEVRTEDDAESVPDALEGAAEVVRNAGLDPDDDAETIAALVEAAAELSDAVDDAEEWNDLTVRQQLQVQGFYDVLDHRKDFPPEWHAIKVHEENDNPEMIGLAYEAFDSDFMEQHCIEAFQRLGAEEALDPMMQLAQRRNRDAVRTLGKIASEEPVEMLIDYADTEDDPQLQTVSLRALGEIGSHDATQAVADRLASDDDEVRSQAARALGLLGDTRAIDPLVDALEEDDADTVRASAAWALNQIGTERALEAVREYADDGAYLVQAEAQKAVEAV